MAKKFKDLKPGDTLYTSYIMPNSEYDKDACTIKAVKFLRDEVEEIPLLIQGKVYRVPKHSYVVDEENGREYKLTLYEQVTATPFGTTIDDSEYMTGSHLYTTDYVRLVNAINEAISKEIMSLNRKIDKFKKQVADLAAKYVN